ncbi:extracellular catalytic domain type 2 short-chain-length polyhydroxyalkanoate depolymerase [Rhizobium halophytocola]|uniref:Poly(3-hydroxybutyrate) depolymerase n=1 Tax=Rhizobium halophytocola TaxID=735519 RepID=A0ABS4DWG3_9HYPH|nr:prolyl oligopeptidase family serine peptidase [Rhizobium halophytocola]MBP1850017.1 poly(3-hydroxybutyrate) depolymerase [Rhizobium halophytocola]
MRSLLFMLTILLLSLNVSLQPSVAHAAEPLPKLNLDISKTTVSGLSSGAFMAVQLETAFSSAIAGAGVVSGGPYNCAEDSVYKAVFGCLVPPWYMYWPAPVADESFAAFKTLEGRIDPLSDIASDRIYLFHGTADDTVRRKSMDVLAEVYGRLDVPAANIRYVTDVGAGHGFLTDEGPVACGVTKPDFLNDCDIDQAGDILKWLYGELAPPVGPTGVADNLLSFDQSAYTEGALGMDDTGFVYIPASCRSGAPCRLHIALHGCQQGRKTIGDAYARLTGYNGWAEANGIVVLYPQAVVIPASAFSPFAGNPKGCWDWWGYSADDYLSRDAPQLAAIARMAAALGAPIRR